MSIRFLTLALIVAMASSCAGPTMNAPSVSDAARKTEAEKQVSLVLKDRVRTLRRVVRVGERILFAGAPLCGDQIANRAGLHVWNAHSLGKKNVALAQRLFGVGDRPVILEVGERTPASNAGLRSGDEIVEINGTAAPAGKEAIKKMSETMKSLNKQGAPYTFRYRRSGKLKTALMRPRKRCKFDFQVINKPDINAYADGSKIVLNSGAVDHFRSDDELAVIFGHELSHNAQGHIKKKVLNTVAAGVGGFVIDMAFAVLGVNTQGAFTRLASSAGQRAHSVGFEREADYVGLYFVALAGYDIKIAPTVWRRMAVKNPLSIKFRTTHPTSAERAVALEKAVREIQAKRASGKALRPDSRKRKPVKPEKSDSSGPGL